MGCSARNRLALRNTRPTYVERNADIFLETGGLSWGDTMVANMIPVVRGKDNVGIINITTFLQTIEKNID